MNPAVFEHVVAVLSAFPVVGVADVAISVDVQSSGAQHAVDLGRESLQLGGAQGHVEQHVAVNGIHAGVRQGKRFTRVAHDRGQPVPHACCCGGIAEFGEPSSA